MIDTLLFNILYSIDEKSESIEFFVRINKVMCSKFNHPLYHMRKAIIKQQKVDFLTKNV